MNLIDEEQGSLSRECGGSRFGENFLEVRDA
jgi:hypothetical protein